MRRPVTLALLSAAVLLAGPVYTAMSAQFFPEREPANREIVFGCDPGPIEEFHHADPPIPPTFAASEHEPARSARLIVHSSRPGFQVQGAGFNLEHTLWSCQPFRRILNRWILQPFEPEFARVDSGQLPLAPEDLSAEELGWNVYHQIMDDPKYQPSWAMLRRLTRAQVKLMLGVWGAPGQFTDDGTRRGRLLPEYYDRYVDYYTAVVDYLVNRQNVRIWSATVMNEPDGGDGSLIDPDEFVEVARRLGPRLAQYGVALYGPDTASAANALPYVDELLATPDVLAYFSAIATHEYFDQHELPRLISMLRNGGSSLPVIVTEYTSFEFGALDRGQEASNEVGQMLESLQVYASLMNAGADAALYWDAVDYYQAGHAAITRWGLLRGPGEAFETRKRYWGFLQVLPYVQQGATVLETTFVGPQRTTPLAIAAGPRRAGELLVAIINRSGPINLSLEFDGPAPGELQMYVTDPDQDYEHAGRVLVADGRASAYVPARSITTFAAAPAPVDDE